MSKCKICKYFVKSEGKKVGGYFNPQPFGPKQPKPEQQGFCHLNPPSVNGQYLTVSENDWCSHCAQGEVEQPVTESDEQVTEQDDRPTV